MNHLEIEYKTLLTKDEYNRLTVLFSHVAPVTQTNYYIDTPNSNMKAKKLSLRIRTLPSHGELTLKIPEKVGNMEYNVKLNLQEAKQLTKTLDFPDCQIKTILLENGIILEELTILGNLTTTRRECQTNIGLMALDVNVYANKKDYELELEVSDAEKGKADFKAFLERNSVDFKYAKSKVARFAATLKHD
ncbi:CYTH domain-containing protein [Streptococcus dentiloxodontae]